MLSRLVLKCFGLGILGLVAPSLAAPRGVTFSQPPGSLEAYDFLEVTANVDGPDAANPFTETTLRGSFTKAGGGARTDVEGFCDSADGSVFRIRFMPSSAGDY